MATAILPDVWLERFLQGRRVSGTGRQGRTAAPAASILSGTGDARKDPDRSAHSWRPRPSHGERSNLLATVLHEQ